MTGPSQVETIAEDTRLVARRPATDTRQVLISMNPRAGARYRRDRIEAIEAGLSEKGFDVRLTTDLAELTSMSEEGQRNGDLRAVIAIGGDGTASVVRNHVPLEVPMLPVPMGTENLLGRYAGQLTLPEDIIRTVEDGVTIRLDLGQANGKFFLLMISAGFDAEVVRTLHETRKGNIRRTAYVGPILQVLRSYGYPKMRLYWKCEVTGEEQSHLCRWLFIFNLPLYALSLPLAPQATGTDGMLDLCAFEHGTLWSVMRYLWHVRCLGRIAPADCRQVRSRGFRLEAPDSPNSAYQLDGDHAGKLPVDVTVLPGQLRLLVPCETAKRVGFVVPEKTS